MKRSIYLLFFICSPIFLFSQNGTVEATNGVIVGNTTSTLDGTIKYDGTDFLGRVSGNWLSLTSGTGGSSLWSLNGNKIFYNTDNVGIGINNPTHTLHITGSGAGNGILVNRAGSSVNTELWSDFSDGGIGTTSNHDFRFVTNSAFRGEISKDGDWGIGTTSPLEKMDVNGAIKIKSTSNSNPGTIRYDSGDFEGYTPSGWESLTGGGSNWTQHTNGIYHDTDNVGIGGTPLTTFELQVTANQNGIYVPHNSRGISTFASSPTTGSLWGVSSSVYGNLNDPSYSYWALASGPMSYAYYAAQGKSLLRDLEVDGELQVGSELVPTGFVMAVDGKAIFEEVQVQVSGSWPDYVFDKEYDLMPLKEVSDFIDTNGHLPNIPKAQTLEDDGIPLGDMQKLMMEKIEELTLYILAQQKEIDALKLELSKK